MWGDLTAALILVAAVYMVILLVAGAAAVHNPGGSDAGYVAAVVRLGMRFFAISYVGIGGVCAALLRVFPGQVEGVVALTSLVASVKLADAAAFTCGKLFGRTKMVPALSPGKTWEGTCGGVLGGALGAYLVLSVIGPWATGEPTQKTTAEVIVYGLMLGVFGVVGDLLESLLKRAAGAKDSSTWLPGLGGILDILDSILFTSPLALLFYWALWR